MNIGSKVARIHPVACFIRDRYVTTVVIWFLLMPVVIYLVGGFGGNLSVSIGTFALAMVPFVVNFTLIRLFPV